MKRHNSKLLWVSLLAYVAECDDAYVERVVFDEKLGSAHEDGLSVAARRRHLLTVTRAVFVRSVLLLACACRVDVAQCRVVSGRVVGVCGIKKRMIRGGVSGRFVVELHSAVCWLRRIGCFHILAAARCGLGLGFGRALLARTALRVFEFALLGELCGRWSRVKR